MSATMPNLKPGQRIGEYVLEAPLGRGTFGQVWRAHHHAWQDRVVAVKVPNDPMYLRSLEAEGAAVHRLAHPNIARAIGFDPYATVPYLITEFIDGESLRDRLDRGKFQPPQASAVLRQVLEGLRHAHAAGVVHRDVKPANVLLEKRVEQEGFRSPGAVKLADFGLGMAGDKEQLAKSIAYSMDVGRDEGVKLVGTLDYMAPEVRAGGEADHRADLYACGVMLYEMLTGEKPAGTDVPSDVVADVPRRLDEVFRKSYARLDRRYASAEEMLRDLHAAVEPPPIRPYAPSANGTPREIVGHVAPPRDCPRCRGEVSGSDQFCMHCGQQLVADVRRCGKCGAYPAPSDSFCIFCGTTLTAASASR